MVLLSKLKSLLGIGGGADDDRRTETTVTVEHDPDETVAEPTDASAAEPAATDSANEPADTQPESEPDDGDAVADNAADETPVAEAAAGQSDGAATASADDAESAAGDEPEPDDAVDDSDAPLDSIKGIGPAYSERLHDAGITSITELAAGDAETIGEAINVSPKTVSNWIDRAGER